MESLFGALVQMLVVLALELTVVFGQAEKLTVVLVLELTVVLVLELTVVLVLELTVVLVLELTVVLVLELTVVFGQAEKLTVVLVLELTVVFGKPFLVETVDYNNHPLELESDHHFLDLRFAIGQAL